jgi:hypothetical protein
VVQVVVAFLVVPTVVLFIVVFEERWPVSTVFISSTGRGY